LLAPQWAPNYKSAVFPNPKHSYSSFQSYTANLETKMVALFGKGFGRTPKPPVLLLQWLILSDKVRHQESVKATFTARKAEELIKGL
jgi:hypothetical protein